MSSPAPDPHLSRLATLWVEAADQTAARSLIETLYPQVLRIVRSHRPQGMAPDELAHEVFVQFFKTLHRYDPNRPLENWLSRVALNVCLKALQQRHQKRERLWSDLNESEQAVIASLASSPSAASPHPAEAKALLASLLDSLSPQDRMILTLLHLEEKSVRQIVQLTGWNSTAIKVRAFRARAKLRKTLQRLESEKSEKNRSHR